jgi:hypothetical protein
MITGTSHHHGGSTVIVTEEEHSFDPLPDACSLPRKQE